MRRRHRHNAPKERKGRHGRHSLFFKMLLALLGMAFFLNLAIGLFFRGMAHGPGREMGQKHIAQYGRLLAKELGNPPDREKALRLADSLRLKIAVHGPEGQTWSVPAGFHPPETGKSRMHPATEGAGSTFVGWKRGRLHVALSEGGWDYVFAARLHSPGHGIPTWPLLWLLAVVTLAIAFAGILLRRMFQPLRTLEKGVLALQRGDLDHRLPEHGRGELAALSRSFNAMAHSLRERLRARDQLLRDVSHELRSPLTRMRLALELSPEGDWRKPIQEDIDSLDTMVAELLESQRLDTQAGALQRSAIRFDRLVAEAVEEFRGQAPGVTLESLPPVMLLGDADRLRIVVRNLVGNALKHGGADAGPVTLTLEQQGTGCTLSVRDHGPGIPPEHLNLVFEPFYRLDSGRTPGLGGYGLGLALSRRIAEAHGGKLELENAPEGGLMARLHLPGPRPEDPKARE